MAPWGFSAKVVPAFPNNLHLSGGKTPVHEEYEKIVSAISRGWWVRLQRWCGFGVLGCLCGY